MHRPIYARPMETRSLDKKRLYFDGCATAHALDLVGERWAMLVIRELMLGPKRFSDIRRNLHGISANVLTQRLEELERIGIVIRRQLPEPASVQVYDLTDWGRELEPAFQVLGRWAARSPFLQPGPMSVNSILMSLETMFDAGRAGDLSARIALTLSGEPCFALISNGKITAGRGSIEAPDLHLTCTSDQLAALIYGGIAPEEWLAMDTITAHGDLSLLTRLPPLFPLPDTVDFQD